MDEPRSTPDPDTPTTPSPGPSIRKKTGKGMLWAVLAVVLAFFIGFFWQWYEATDVRDELAMVEEDLLVERLRTQLANAALAAQSGDFESARTEMSDFFQNLQAQQEDLPTPLQSTAQEALDQRDDIITGLSRSNPEYAGVLYRLLGQFMADGQTVATPEAAPAGGGGM